jgi:hypothetical protein
MVVGTSTATCLLSDTALNAALIAISRNVLDTYNE